jgi:4-diphosphocytidyl-2-C-methyl-D-erythritol kinase
MYNRWLMAITVRSFAKINLGLRIGALRPDGFHELRTVYQIVAINDIVRVRLGRGNGIQIQCDDRRVPTNEWNTCYRVVERALTALNVHPHVVIEIDKRLPVQGGLGGASGNAVAALLALGLAIRKSLPFPEKLRIAAEVGSDLPLFLIGGTILGVGRGEEVYPLPDLPATACVIATPDIAVSTPKAFADWDLLCGSGTAARRRAGLSPSGDDFEPDPDKLTPSGSSDRMLKFGYSIAAWLSGFSQRKTKAGLAISGVPAGGRGRAETPLLDLVRTGIENDFERVVFSQYPELREVKRLLEQAGAQYASLSGSGSALYGLFASSQQAARAAARLKKAGIPAVATSTMTRQQYWRKFLVSRS